MDGKMVDAPVVGKARAVRVRAEACGVDVAGGREGGGFVCAGEGEDDGG